MPRPTSNTVKSKPKSKPKAKTPAKQKVKLVNYPITKTLIDLSNNHHAIFAQMETEDINTETEIRYIHSHIDLKPAMLTRISTARAKEPLRTWIRDNKKMEKVQRENSKSAAAASTASTSSQAPFDPFVFATAFAAAVTSSKPVSNFGNSGNPGKSNLRPDVITLDKRPGVYPPDQKVFKREFN